MEIFAELRLTCDHHEKLDHSTKYEQCRGNNLKSGRIPSTEGKLAALEVVY